MGRQTFTIATSMDFRTLAFAVHLRSGRQAEGTKGEERGTDEDEEVELGLVIMVPLA